MKNDNHIVMLGDPASGFWFHGPFDSEGDATEFAEKHLTAPWWVMKLNDPADIDAEDI